MYFKSSYQVKAEELLKRLIQNGFYYGGTITLSIILFFGTPLGLICSMPLFAWRYFIGILAKVFKPELGKMLCSRSAVFAVDSMYKKPKSNVVIRIVLEGEIELKDLKTTFKTKIIGAKHPDGNLCYPELQQSVTKWQGYFFWKCTPDFKIYDHINLADKRIRNPQKDESGNSSNPITEKDLQSIQRNLIQQPWKPNKPLWKVELLQNCLFEEKKCCVIFLVSSHCLADGYSIYNLLKRCFDEKQIKNAEPHYPKTPNLFRRIMLALTFPFRMCWDLAAVVVYPHTPFTPVPFKASYKYQSGNVLTHVGNRLSVQTVKTVKTHHKVRFSSVILSMVSGAVRDLMIRKGETIPKVFPSIIPLPIRGHPDKLRNYLGAGVAPLGTGEADVVERLNNMDQSIERLKTSTFPLSSFFGFLIMGSYYWWTTKILVRNYFSTAWLTAFPGGIEPISFMGRNVLDVSCMVGLQKGTTGIGFAIVTQGESIRVSVIADASILTLEDVKYACNQVEENLNVLAKTLV